MFDCPISSPKMTRIFGFFPEEGAGDCAFVVKTQISAKLSDAKSSFVFMMLIARLVGIAPHTIKKNIRFRILYLGLRQTKKQEIKRKGDRHPGLRRGGRRTN